ncbi:ATP-binding cassette domain-containing protein [Herbidospora sp. NEAU-GS84]|uniref:ATP-binding cassette domain-containing protein n=1 Tax=Herbidospora solisilvae TaxID=2696284 RepID=A0A7C9JJM5_9ACTN|nr:ABC transporter ATP-binding protein [Herbidospora solisilvae]NAS26783.1 ATP-binding cassette domain-containing protein [Herbidospora solisilvae]
MRRGTAGLLRVLSGHLRPFGISVLFAVVNQAAGMGAVVLAAATAGQALSGAADLWPLFWWTLGLTAVRAVANWVESWISHELSFRVLAQVRQWLYQAFARIAPGGLIRRRGGDLVVRALRDSESLEIFYAHTSIYVAAALVVAPAALAAMAMIGGGWAALVLLPWMAASAAVPLALRRAGARHGGDLTDALTELNVEVTDLVQGLREILSFGRGADRLDRLRDADRRLAAAQRRQARRAGLETVAGGAAIGGASLSVLATGLHTGLPAPALLASVALAGAAFTPITMLLNVTRVWGLTSSSADRVFDLLEEPAAVPDTGRAPLPVLTGPPAVEFDEVVFGYDETRPVLRGVSLTVPGGTTLALAGATGAGKSTLAHLLLRHFDPASGTVRIGGADLRDLPVDDLTELVCHVPQEAFLFHDTLRANLELARPGASAEDVAQACADARVTPFLDRLPDGLDTVVGERGAALSGGERQRVAIARALLRDRPVLVLDESSSQLDALSEHELQAALDRVRNGRTTLVIAHRLTTLRHADLVAVLDHGRIADLGRHAELMARCAPYRRLVQAQADAAALLDGRPVPTTKRGGDP